MAALAPGLPGRECNEHAGGKQDPHHTGNGKRFAGAAAVAAAGAEAGIEFLANSPVQLYRLCNLTMVHGLSSAVVSLAKIFEPVLRRHLRQDDGTGTGKYQDADCGTVKSQKSKVKRGVISAS